MNSYFLDNIPAKQDTNLIPFQERWRNLLACWVMLLGLLAVFLLGSMIPTVSLAVEETIDVMVVYTSSAATSEPAKNAGGIDSLISQRIVNTNKSYTNSSVKQKLNQVDLSTGQVPSTGQVSSSYDESKAWDSILDDLKNDRIALFNENNQIVANVHELRDRHFADVVVLLVNKEEGCGEAHQMNKNDGEEFADSAFAVVNVNNGCLNGAFGGYAFARQLGHLMGCTDEQGYKPTPFTCTIMTPKLSSGLCVYINNWSNIEVKYQGKPTGDDATHNCAATLNQTAKTVANFRYPKPGTLQFKTLPQNVDENVGTVTIEVSRTDGKDGKVSVDLKNVTSSTNNPATFGDDYTVNPSLSTTLEWEDWDESSRFITVSIIDDTLTEAEEAIKFALSNVTGGATLGEQKTTQVNINYNQPGTLQFKTGPQSVSVNEDEGTVTFEVTRTDGKEGEVSIEVIDNTSSLNNNPATIVSDYTVTPSPLILTWGDWDDSSKTVTVSIVDDTLMENKEYLKFTLSKQSVTGGATLGKQKFRKVLIKDDDGANTAFVIDNTGSMGEEIAGVQDALTKYTQKRVDSGNKPPHINFMTFRDEPFSWGITNDLTTVQNWVDGLIAAGGGDCSEGSVEALNLAEQNLKPKGTIFLATDASPHVGVDIDATIAKLRAKSIKVNVIVTGDCIESNTRRGDRAPLKFLADIRDPNANLFADNHDHDFSIAAPLNISSEDVNATDSTVISTREVYSRIAYETGGSFVFMPEVNDGNELDATRFSNSSYNIMVGIDLPAITDITPNITVPEGTLDITLNASNTNFNDSSSVSFGDGIVVNGVEVVSATQIIANITVQSNANLGFYDARVTTSLGTEIETAEGKGALVNLADGGWSGILSVAPFTGIKGTTETVKISGFATHFDDTSVLSFGASGINVQSLDVHSPTFLTAEIKITSEAEAGLHNVQVTTGSEVAERWNIFLVLSEVVKESTVPKITAITPSQGRIGTTLDIEILGTATNFLAETEENEESFEESFLEFSGSGMTVLYFEVISATRAVATLEIDFSAALGYRDVFVNTGDETAAMLNGFEILPELSESPEITQVTPTNGEREHTLDIEIIGQRTHFLAGESVVNIDGTSITVLSTIVNSLSEIIANIQIDDSAKLGWRDISVTTGSEIVILHDGFEAVPKKSSLQENTPAELLDRYLINGRIIGEDGEPIEGVTLQVGDKTAKTNALGYWEILGLLAGDYTIVASKVGYTFAPTDFTLGEGDFIVEVKVELVINNNTGLEFKQTYANNIVADGFVERREWNAADYAVDLGGSSNGVVYAMGRRNYPISDYKYNGCFLFLLHNIELLTTQYEADYNVFDIYPADAPNNPLLIVWVFNDIDNSAETDSDWLAPAGLLEDFSELDDRGFLVYNYELGEYRQWLPEDAAPADGTYDWDVYWGIHAMGGFNNSAFNQGLPEAINNDNALYEVIYRAGSVEMCQEGPTLLLQRSIKDPDERGPTFPLIPYWQGEIEVNRPLSVTLYSFTAQATDNGKVALNWLTGTEANNAGFVVWRGQPLNGVCSNNPNNYTDVKAITPLVNSTGNDVSGAAYMIDDSDVAFGNTYCYVLEDVDYEGKSTYHLNSIRSAAVK